MPSFFNIEKIRGLLSQTLNDDKFAASMFHPGGNRRSIVDSVMDARSTAEVNTNADLLHAVVGGMADYLRGYPCPASYKQHLWDSCDSWIRRIAELLDLDAGNLFEDELPRPVARDLGIRVNATIYHWDLPYALQAKGGFGNREITEWYLNYASILFDNFGDLVDYWVTFNEPIATYVGHAKGFFAPGLSDEKYARQCIHHLLLCHGEAVKLFRSRQLPGQIGVVVDVWKHYPARPDNPEDIASAMMNNEIEGYGMFLHPLFLGGYSEELTAYMEETGFTPKTEPGDMERICQKLDFYGLNFYNGLYDNADEQRAAAEGGNFQNRPELHLEAVYDVLHMLVEEYGIDVPIYITENGVAQDDGPDRKAILNDDERIAYVSETLRHVRRAMDDGIDVRGYYLWSLMDNFEWSAGFAARFGLYYTDYEKMELIPKKSAGWYRDLIRNRGFED